MEEIKTNRKVAMIAGLIFLVTEVSAIAGVLLYGPILNDFDYIIKGTAKETQIVWGAFFEIILAFANIGTAITLYPILKKYNGSMALGTVCFRLLEATIIIIGIMSLLTIVTLNHDYSKEINPNTSSYLISGKLLVSIHNWTFLYGPNLILGPSTLMTSYLLYKSKLVPPFISVLGLVGGPLISLSAVLVMFGAYPQISVWGGLLGVPVFAYEISLAVRLIGKGFNSPAVDYAITS